MSPFSATGDGRKTRRAQGFTLIELLTVVGILAIVAGGAIFAYDHVQRRAELAMAQRQLATVRDALLRFRIDMGYFPGEGPLAPAHLDLSGVFYVDGDNPGNAEPADAIRQRWARHPMNFWMLYEQPKAPGDPLRWNYNRTTGRGWRGPYLGAGYNWRLDQAGEPAAGFTGSPSSNRLLAVADLIQRPTSSQGPLQWVSESTSITTAQAPEKKPQPGQGSPILFTIDPTSTLNTVIYRVISAGEDGIFQTIGPIPAGDDIGIEVTRRSTL